MHFLGFDIGSSSIKASVIDGETGFVLASSSYPETEMPISSPRPGWAEQQPEDWWGNIVAATKILSKSPAIDPNRIAAIGIAYQMHGLVLVDKDMKVLLPSIIWCDSRAVRLGEEAFLQIGEELCLDHLLNSPGNFTASKLAWVKKYEPQLYEKVYKIMLPGDYIAMRLTNEVNTTISGLSEGVFWDFKENAVSDIVLNNFGFERDIIPDIVPTFGEQGYLVKEAAKTLGLKPGIPISYRAGDQPNNAFSLNVLNPGELAATAGTSGVVYGVSDKRKFDPLSRVNTFAHVNHKPGQNSLGVLMCVNGTGSLNSWLKRNMAQKGAEYNDMNRMAGDVSVGSDGIVVLPFGNGAERILNNRNIGSVFSGINFNIHTQKHIFRAAQEGIAFAFQYGIEIMKSVGIQPNTIRAGKTNMFLSDIFRETLSGISGATIELYDTDGAQGAARGAGLGSGFFRSPGEAFTGLSKVDDIHIDSYEQLTEAYQKWLEKLEESLIIVK